MNLIVWKDLYGYEGYYKINNIGEVYSIRNNLLIRQQIDKKGYSRTVLSLNGIRKNHKTHRLVALTFIPNPNNFENINHIDENKLNNNIDNLEWCTTKYNNSYANLRERQAKSNRNRQHKLIGQYTLSGELVRTYNGLRDTLENGYIISCVCACCNNKKYNHTHKGYIWKYIDNK